MNFHPTSECPRLTGCPLCADPENARPAPAGIHRLVQFAHQGYTAERLAFVFYAETKAIFAAAHSYESLDAAMRELLSAMEDAREIIGD